MQQCLKSLILLTAVSTASLRVLAAPDIERMSDMEVTEYAEDISNLIRNIEYYNICPGDNPACFDAEFRRHGMSYDDMQPVQKRLFIMLGSIN